MRKYAAVLLLLLACSPPRAQFTSATDTTQVLRDERDVAAIGAAYRERVRLGLGSPFRVIEIAAYDPRLSDRDREELLEQLFERVLDGNTYEMGATLPLAHYRVIEHALGSTYDPRIAELAVNLAYEAAVNDSTVTPELQYAATSTIALMRDRALAQHDARYVRDVAHAQDTEAYVLVPAMRAQRALLLEQPLMPSLNMEAQAAAQKLAGMLIGGVRQAARSPQPFTMHKETSELPKDVAERILALQTRVERPPQSALIIAMRAAQLPYAARDEETFVAELALINENTALAAQRAAIALRPFAQERMYPHEPVPARVRERERDRARFLADFGITLKFKADVPEAQQPHYARVLHNALSDLQLALPGVSLTGLTLEVGEVESAERHLAYHDPRTRTIRWSPTTGAGSLAHEIAHDLDWQRARRSYGRSGYASDLAGDVAGMLLVPQGYAPDERATEILARRFDWLVAAALAGMGRMNGQLSSVQHDWLPGHGGAQPPLANARSALALAAFAAGGGRLGAGAQERIKVATLAPDLPAAVHAVRRARQGLAPAAMSEVRTPCCITPRPESGVSPFSLLTFPR